LVFCVESKKMNLFISGIINIELNMSQLIQYSNQIKKIKDDSMINLETHNVQGSVEQLIVFADFYHSLLVDENEELDYREVLANGYIEIGNKNKLSAFFQRIFGNKSKETLMTVLGGYTFEYLAGKRDGDNVLKPTRRIINLINEECFKKIDAYIKSMYE